MRGKRASAVARGVFDVAEAATCSRSAQGRTLVIRGEMLVAE
jgi:hypothetical protein